MLCDPAVQKARTSAVLDYSLLINQLVRPLNEDPAFATPGAGEPHRVKPFFRLLGALIENHSYRCLMSGAAPLVAFALLTCQIRAGHPRRLPKLCAETSLSTDAKQGTVAAIIGPDQRCASSSIASEHFLQAPSIH